MTDSNATELAKTWFECFCNRKAICPWCGYEDEDSWEYEEGETGTECPNCEKPFIVIAEPVMEYTTKPEGGWPNDR